MQSGSRHVIVRRSRTSHVCVYHTVVPLTTAVQLCLQVLHDVHRQWRKKEERTERSCGALQLHLSSALTCHSPPLQEKS